MKNSQTKLFEYFEMKPEKVKYNRLSHGGANTKGKRKEFRPLDKNKWTHLILKSDKAKGRYSFLTAKNKIYIQQALKLNAKKFGIKIADYANVGNHLHLKIKISSRENFQKFLKSITSIIARFVTGARKGKPFGRFWQGLAYTRVLTSALEERYLRGYIESNRIEAAHSKAAREDFLESFRKYVYRARKKSKAIN